MAATVAVVLSVVVVLLHGTADATYTIDKTCECGIRNTAGSSAKIVNGNVAKPNEFPWVVGLYVTTTDDGPFCGGALISNTHVLTAAHCLEVTANYVSLADFDYSTVMDGSKFAAVLPYTNKDAIHPKFAYDGLARVPLYDVAVLQLQSPIVWADMPNARPLCLPNPAINVVSAEGIVAGWGVLAAGSMNRSSQLLYTVQDVITNAACNQKYNTTNNSTSPPKPAAAIQAMHICAVGKVNGSDTCQGDSGGALFTVRNGSTPARYEILGTTSFEWGCGNEGYPGVYCRTSQAQVIQFILAKLVTSTASVCNGFLPIN